MFGRLTDLIENARELSLPSVFLFVVNNKKPINKTVWPKALRGSIFIKI